MADKSKAGEKYRHADHVSWRKVENEAVVLDLNTSDYFSLNETGLVVWEKLGEGADLHGLAEAVCAEYDVDEKQAMADAKKLVGELLKKKLIQPA